MEEAIDNKREEREKCASFKERERESFEHARGLGKEGGSPKRLEGEVGKLSCEACMKRRCVCVEGEREMPQVFH